MTSPTPCAWAPLGLCDTPDHQPAPPAEHGDRGRPQYETPAARVPRPADECEHVAALCPLGPDGRCTACGLPPSCHEY